MMCCVTKATPIKFINGNKLKSCKTGLTNHTWPLSHHWLLIPLGADAQAPRHTHILTHEQKRFREDRRA